MPLVTSGVEKGNTNISRLEDIGSDHYPLLLKIEESPLRNIIMNAPKWNLKGVNWNQWAKDIPSITINRNTTNVEALHNDIEERINHSNKINIKKSKTKETTWRSTPWFNETCKTAIIDRRKARKILEKYPTNENLQN